MTDYMLVTYVGSKSDPDGPKHPVKTDGKVLTCDCNGWTRRTHFPDCPQLDREVSCTCGFGVHRGEKVLRVCRHTREVTRQCIAALGSVDAAIRLLRRGVDLDLPGEGQNVPTAVQRGPDAIRREAEAVAGRFERFLGTAPLQTALRDGIEAAIRKFAGRAPAQEPASASALAGNRPDWLGGGRAILLRD